MNNNENVILSSNSAEMKKVLKLIDKVSTTNINIHLYGEAGTGKEFFAKIIHDKSKRSGAVIFIDPQDIIYRKNDYDIIHSNLLKAFNEAKGGTMVIDDIASMSITFQRVFLSSIRKVDEYGIRLISISVRNIEELTRQARINQELYNRLCIVKITIPSLRDRRDDIPQLIEITLKSLEAESGSKKAVSQDVIDILLSYEFPGNVRELEAIIKHGYIHSDSDTITQQHLTSRIKAKRMVNVKSTLLDDLYKLSKNLLEYGSYSDEADSYYEYMRIVETPLIKASLDLTNNNVSKSAKLIKINRNTLMKKIKEYSIE